MSLLSLKEEIIASVPTPSVGRYTYFIDSVSKQLYVKNSSGVSSPVSNFSDTFQLYPATHTTSLTTSIYTLDLTGKPTPVVGKQINIKLSAANTYSTIQVVIPTLGTFNLFKVGGVPFAAGELKVGQIISFIIDSGTAYYLSGFLQSNVIPVADTAAMQALMAANQLVAGSFYQFNFATKYTLNSGTVTAPVESMIVRAISTNSVTSQAVSAAYPQDIIEIDITSGALYGGKILRRFDPVKKLDAPFDWRNVKFRRGKDATSNKYIESNPAAATFASDFLDVYCFDNSQSGGNCYAIRIAPQSFTEAVVPGSTYAPWGLVDTNIVFSGFCRNIDVMSGCYALSFYSLGASLATDPVQGHSLLVQGVSESIIGQASRGSIVDCKKLTVRGIYTASQEHFGISYLHIKNSDNTYVDGSSTKVTITGCSNVYIGPSNTSILLEDCENVWITGSTRVNIYGSKDVALKGVTDATYDNVESFAAVSSSQERISSSRNLASLSVSGCNIEALKDAYQYRDKTCNVVAVQAGTPQVLVAAIASASFAEGDMVAVTNSIGILSKATAIAFDTNADNIADTGTYPLVVADFQQFYPTGLAAVAGNFYLMYSSGKFHLLFSVLNCPFKLDTNNSQFDGIDSNIQKTVAYSGGAIAISNPTDYDYGHVGILKISHAGANDVLSQITHTTGKYPKLKRELRNNNVGNIISLTHGLGANLISLPGGIQRQINAALDMAEIDLDSASQWRVLRTTSSDDSSYAQRVVIPLSAAQIKTMNSLPLMAVAAQGSNKAIKLIDAQLVYRAGTIAFNFASNMYFRIGGVAVSTTIATAGNIDSLTSQVLFFKGLDIAIPLATINNALLQLFADANSALGDGTATLIVNYRIIDLP